MLGSQARAPRGAEGAGTHAPCMLGQAGRDPCRKPTSAFDIKACIIVLLWMPRSLALEAAAFRHAAIRCEAVGPAAPQARWRAQLQWLQACVAAGRGGEIKVQAGSRGEGRKADIAPAPGSCFQRTCAAPAWEPDKRLHPSQQCRRRRAQVLRWAHVARQRSDWSTLPSTNLGPCRQPARPPPANGAPPPFQSHLPLRHGGRRRREHPRA
jgi:hypothetical protein